MYPGYETHTEGGVFPEICVKGGCLALLVMVVRGLASKNNLSFMRAAIINRKDVVVPMADKAHIL